MRRQMAGDLQTGHPVTCFCSPQSRAEPLPEEHVRFYAAAVILGLEYMQNHDLVWRCARHTCCQTSAKLATL